MEVCLDNLLTYLVTWRMDGWMRGGCLLGWLGVYKHDSVCRSLCVCVCVSIACYGGSHKYVSIHVLFEPRALLVFLDVAISLSPRKVDSLRCDVTRTMREKEKKTVKSGRSDMV